MECRQTVKPKGWVYFADGNANALYKHSEYPGLLLRLRKQTAGPLSTADVHAFHESSVRPHLGPFALDMELVSVPEQVYDELDPAGTHLRREAIGLLMPRIGGPAGSVVVQFKPKWLVQSPNAPKDARCCRTCALGALRGRSRTWCPLDLAGGPDHVQRWARSVADESSILLPTGATALLETALVQYFTTKDLVARLIERQKLDADGALAAGDEPSPDLCEAMTYRDCTILFELRTSSAKLRADPCWLLIHDTPGEGRWVARAIVVDLDPKPPSKLAHWVKTEQSLQSYYLQPAPACALSSE